MLTLRHWRWRMIRSRLAAIQLVVFDVDGVLTDGGLWFGPEGELIKRFDVRDGLGIRLLKQTGIEIALISGGQGGATQIRAKQLGIEHCIIGAKDKSACLRYLQQQTNHSRAETLFLGDDLNDLTVLPEVSLLIAPSDAARALRRRAHITLKNKGGNGAVRELADRILHSRGILKTIESQGWAEQNDVPGRHTLF